MSLDHILDNPIWNALATGNKAFAFAGGQAAYIRREVGFFAGLKTNSEADLVDLHALLPGNGPVILLHPGELSIPSRWNIQSKKEVLQMWYPHPHSPVPNVDGLVTLGDKDIPAMLELTGLTNPGPFFSRSIDYGNYEGIFEGDELVAMAGQRLNPEPYLEVSAVCTRPGHTGKGYAAKLVISQLSKILGSNSIPFLHVYPDNIGAIKLYEKLGFQARQQLQLYLLKKSDKFF